MRAVRAMSSQRSTLQTTFEHPVGGRKLERLHHLGDERRLRRHLTVRDRQRRILVGMCGEIRRDELRPRDRSDGFEETRVTNAMSARGGDEIRRLGHGRSAILVVVRDGEPSLPRCP
jgi:hypothetical protein